METFGYFKEVDSESVENLIFDVSSSRYYDFVGSRELIPAWRRLCSVMKFSPRDMCEVSPVIVTGEHGETAEHCLTRKIIMTEENTVTNSKGSSQPVSNGKVEYHGKNQYYSRKVQLEPVKGGSWLE